MSLFGDEDDANSNLFGDAPSKKNGGLFGDDTADPWIPTPKKKAEPSRVLANCHIPDLYVEIFESYSTAGVMSFTKFKELMNDANLTESDKESIVSIILPGDTSSNGLSRALTNVALVLISLAQEGEELSMDAVDDKKAQNLPLPVLSANQNKREAEQAPRVPIENTHTFVASEPQQTTLDSYITTLPASAPGSKTQSERQDDLNDPWSPNRSPSHTPRFESSNSEVVEAGYTPSRTTTFASEIDAVTIRALEGKEGIPLWKHINYEVKSARRKSSVVRRYSDFAWLLECLLKKYPFRQIPLLPPKRLAVHGIHLHVGKQADMIFLEKRRRGLSRFANALERHPTFKGDQLVTTFLTVPTELAVWRKQASITIKEEFEDRYLAADLEASLPQGIDEWMFKTQIALKGAIESFTSLTSLQERLIKRKEAMSTDLLRFSLSINTFCEQESGNCDILGKEHGPGLINGLRAVSKHHTSTQGLMEIECRHLEDTSLEDFKRHRDTLNAMNELFVRHTKHSGDNIPSLEKRIVTSKTKLSTLEAKPDAKESDKEKLRTSISNDQNLIVKLESRRIFIRECLWRELQFFETQQVHISKLVTDMANSRADFAKKDSDIAQALVGDVEGMP